MEKQFFLLLLGIFALECTGQDAFNELPVNTQGQITQNVTLNCELSNPAYSLVWKNPSGFTVYEKGFGILPGYEGQYEVEELGNSYNLIVLNAAEDDAGQYGCECPTLSSTAYAEIILLAATSSGNSLQCVETTSNADNDFGNVQPGDQITLTCETIFYGLWGPTQDWMDSLGQPIDPSDVSAGNIVAFINTETVMISDNGSFWIVDSYFPPPPEGAIPDDVTTPPTEYYSRTVPVPALNEEYRSSEIVVSGNLADGEHAIKTQKIMQVKKGVKGRGTKREKKEKKRKFLK